MVGELANVIRQQLEVRAVVAGGKQTETLRFGRDVIGAFLIAEPTDLPPLHGVIRKLVEADLQVAHIDGGLGRRGGDARGVAVGVDLGGLGGRE